MKYNLYFGLTLIGWLLIPQISVVAQETDTNEAIKRCGQIDDEFERYQCYDQVLRPGEAKKPSSSPSSSAPPRPTQPALDALPPETERDRFGVKERDPTEPGYIDVTVVSIGESKLGRLIFYTEDGQAWQQADNKKTPMYRNTPFAARIKRGTMDSFYIKPDSGGFSVRVLRKK